ncbi:transcriptional regulator [Flavobacterium cheongpyeongense]|uniref:Transcriptional regulator n=1 Tax=Flavobacterium cheongpyeongense TaxID=2212651 RepID=A0A2V4BLU9_9FLAO|nr:helix-turn-helix transcriptional regulator [Flavobacterium cheongpyeongense]PXY38680.1 transcriptional regulator [Flavobacterium cheongpyeongense]
MEQKIHQGRNVKRFREMLNIKQEALAYDLGEDWNQKKISMLEQKDVIEDSLLKQISAVLKIPVEAFQNFDEEQAVNVIANTYSFQDFKDNAVASGFSYQPSFNPVDKVIELYERLVQAEKDKVEYLEKLLKGR